MGDLIYRLRDAWQEHDLCAEAADALAQKDAEIAERDALIRTLQSRLAKAEEAKNIEQDAYDILAKQSEAEIARLREALASVATCNESAGASRCRYCHQIAREALQEQIDD